MRILFDRKTVGKVIAAVTLIIFIVGCGGAQVELGPKPATVNAKGAEYNKLVGELRAWVTELEPQDSKTLLQEGKLVMTRQRAEKSRKQCVQVIEKYMSDRYKQTIKKAAAKGLFLDLPDTFTLTEVTFQKLEQPGAFEVVIRDESGFSNFFISDPIKKG